MFILLGSLLILGLIFFGIRSLIKVENNNYDNSFIEVTPETEEKIAPVIDNDIIEEKTTNDVTKTAAKSKNTRKPKLNIAE